jgi:2-polyprenyl-6-methoxyphenol hydroxylase-like FAD-dependent oxidoreductase
VRLDNGTYAIAIGEAWVINDPLTGQGANLGSACAFLLADAIRSGPPFDEHFCRTAEATIWAAARSVTEWTKLSVQPPPPHVIDLLEIAATDERVAHAFLNNFNDPTAMWDSVATPEHVTAFLYQVRGKSLTQTG